MAFSFSLALGPEWIRKFNGRALLNVRKDGLLEEEPNATNC
jgi:hypothetical protein